MFYIYSNICKACILRRQMKVATLLTFICIIHKYVYRYMYMYALIFYVCIKSYSLSLILTNKSTL